MQQPWDAVVLAGGRGSRLGGVAKPALPVGGVRLIDLAVGAAIGHGARSVVVVGPDDLLDHAQVAVVRENPPFGGPVAALAAALPLVDAPWVLLLAADLPRATEACAAVLSAIAGAAADTEAVVPIDADGRQQWTAAGYRTDPLRALVASLPAGGQGQGLGRVLGGLRRVEITDAAGWTADVDTPADLAAARQQAHLRHAGSNPPAARRRSDVSDAPANDGPKKVPAEDLVRWLNTLAEELGDPDAATNTITHLGALLSVTKDIAHQVARPAAPLTTWVLGEIVARNPSADPAELIAKTKELAEGWDAQG